MSRKIQCALAALVVLGAISLLALIQPSVVSAQTSGELLEQLEKLEAEQSQLQSHIRELEESLADNAQQTKEQVRQKSNIDEQIFLLCQQQENTQRQITAYNLLIADTQEDLEQARADLDELHLIHKQRLRTMEEQGQMSYWSVLLCSANMSDFLDNMTMLREIVASDKQRLTLLQTAAEQVKHLETDLQQKRGALEDLQKQQESTRISLQEKRDQADALLQSLLTKGDAYSKLLLDSEEKQETLMQLIAQKENDYDLQARQEWLATSEPETTPPPETTPAESTDPVEKPEAPQPDPEEENDPDQWLTPVPYYTLSSPFGMRLHPILGIWRMHNGVDLSCAQGTEIYASRSGVVSIADYEDEGAGHYIQINHGDGYRSVYMHMTHYVVKLGDSVKAGQLIGYVGSTGLSDGPHLHFGISYNGTYLNPMEFIG